MPPTPAESWLRSRTSTPTTHILYVDQARHIEPSGNVQMLIYLTSCTLKPNIEPVDISTYTGYSICNCVHASTLILANAPVI